MIHIPSVVDVPVPAEDVFAYLSDPATNAEWSPNALEVSDIPDGPTALGTRYRVKLKFFGRVNFLIDEFEPGHRVRFNCDPPAGNSLTGSSSTRFRAAPGSTILSSSNRAASQSSPSRSSGSSPRE